MALHEINYKFQSEGEYEKFPKGWSHTGVVGSGDMEVLMKQADLSGAVEVKVITPITGFDHVWEKVLDKFIRESKLGDLIIQINDNNATPYIVSTRLKQALIEAKEAIG
ncbi:MAG: malonate decarboxylase acyl carrier protein [Lachnospiraceae bacterium]